jgi:antitoxin ParD1/3/4
LSTFKFLATSNHRHTLTIFEYNAIFIINIIIRRTNMHVSLTPELESRVKSKVKSGLYNNASEVIRDALRFMDTHEEWIHEIKLAQLREQLNVGIMQISREEGIAIKSKESLNKLFDAIKE